MWVWDLSTSVSVAPSPQEMSMPSPTKLMVMLWSGDAVLHVVINGRFSLTVTMSVRVWPSSPVLGSPSTAGAVMSRGYMPAGGRFVELSESVLPSMTNLVSSIEYVDTRPSR